MNLFIYTFAVFGLAYIVGHSKISLDFRTWLSTKSRWAIELLECVACLSFHTGWISYLLGVRIVGSYGPWWLDMIVAALYTCASSLVLGKFVGIVE